jgi:hypothetical protein
MTQDLSKMCIIEKSILARLVETCNYEYGIDDTDAMYALGQDLSKICMIDKEHLETLLLMARAYKFYPMANGEMEPPPLALEEAEKALRQGRIDMNFSKKETL